MKKVIKGEFEKLEDLKVKDVSLTCDTSLKVFNNEFNRLREMDDDLFTYEVEVANILCDSNKDDDSEQRVSHESNDDIGYDLSDVAFTQWLGSKFSNYKTMDHYTKKALWIYWIIGDDEVELTDEEFSDNEDEVAEVFRIDTNIFDFETPIGWVWGWFRLAAMVVVACGVRCGGGSDEGVVGVEWEMAAVGVDDEGGVYGGGAAAGGRSVVWWSGVEMMKVLWGGRSGGGSSEVAARWEKAAGMEVVSWGCEGDEMMWWGGCSW
ncbi:hypothetical protein Tco_0986090 [Tanacetum coccineum]